MIEKLQRTNPDIAQFVTKNDKRVRFHFYILTAFLILFYFLVIYEYVLVSKGLIWALVVVPIIPVMTFFLSGGMCLFDPSFEGEVTKVVFSVRLDASDNPRLSSARGGSVKVKVGSMSARQVNYTKFYVIDRYGKKHRYAVQLPDNRIDLGIKAGDRIRKYHGLPYPILLSDPMSICPVCGSVNHKNDPYCYDCGFSVVKEI